MKPDDIEANICAFGAFMAPFFAVVLFGTNVHYIWFIFSIVIKTFMPEAHLLKVLFRMKLMGNISTKAP